jgi:hypothetical protein
MLPRESIGLFSWPSAIHLAPRPDLSSRSIRATVDAANERSGFSLASEFTFATRIDPSTRSTRRRRERTFRFFLPIGIDVRAAIRPPRCHAAVRHPAQGPSLFGAVDERRLQSVAAGFES